MATFAPDLSITIDGVDSALLAIDNPLVRAVVISLFSWRRADASDRVDGDARFGWWGDGLDGIANDRIGSKLWLLAREKLTAETLERAREYAHEALQWLVDDGVATAVTVTVERLAVDGAAMKVEIDREGQAPLTLRLANAWSLLNV
jgi:phage gp46-like protein